MAKLIVSLFYSTDAADEEFVRHSDWLRSVIGSGRIQSGTLPLRKFPSYPFIDILSDGQAPHLKVGMHEKEFSGRVSVFSQSCQSDSESTRTAFDLSNLVEKVRFGLGFHFALQLLFIENREINSGVTHSVSGNQRAPLVFARNDEINVELRHIDLANPQVEIRPDVAILLRSAETTLDWGEKFLFLWIALEATLGDGNTRGKFCEEQLKSTDVSVEMKRLFSVRGSIAHKGHLNTVSERDLVSILKLLRICFNTSSEQQQRLLQTYHQWLSSDPT